MSAYTHLEALDASSPNPFSDREMSKRRAGGAHFRAASEVRQPARCARPRPHARVRALARVRACGVTGKGGR
jgi:hypothetical protein